MVLLLCWRLTDDQSLSCQLVRQANFVARRALHELDIGNLVPDLDKGRSGAVKGSGVCQAADGLGAQWETASGEHDDFGLMGFLVVDFGGCGRRPGVDCDAPMLSLFAVREDRQSVRSASSHSQNGTQQPSYLHVV